MSEAELISLEMWLDFEVMRTLTGAHNEHIVSYIRHLLGGKGKV